MHIGSGTDRNLQTISSTCQSDASEARFFSLFFFSPPPPGLYRWIFRKRQLRVIGLSLLASFFSPPFSLSRLGHVLVLDFVLVSASCLQQHAYPCPSLLHRFCLSLEPDTRKLLHAVPAVLLPDGNGFSHCPFTRPARFNFPHLFRKTAMPKNSRMPSSLPRLRRLAVFPVCTPQCCVDKHPAAIDSMRLLSCCLCQDRFS